MALALDFLHLLVSLLYYGIEFTYERLVIHRLALEITQVGFCVSSVDTDVRLVI